LSGDPDDIFTERRSAMRVAIYVVGLLGGLLLVNAPVAQADRNGPRCDGKDYGKRKDIVEMCSEIRTTVSPRVAKSSFTVKFEPRAVESAVRCQATTWVLLLDQQGKKIGESSRTTKACDASLGISKTTVEQATPTRAYYAIAKGCVDLYPSGGKHSVWQDCQESEKVGFNRN
jgi:hypothetical protein